MFLISYEWFSLAVAELPTNFVVSLCELPYFSNSSTYVSSYFSQSVLQSTTCFHHPFTCIMAVTKHNDLL